MNAIMHWLWSLSPSGLTLLALVLLIDVTKHWGQDTAQFICMLEHSSTPDER